VLVFVVGDRLGDFARQPVHGQVHEGNVDGVRVLLLAVEDDLLGGVAAGVLDEVAGLDEHAPGAAGRIEDLAVIRLDDVDDHLHQRRRREELAVVVGVLDRELGQEVFVNAAEYVARGVPDLLAVEQPHEIFKHLGLEDAVILGQDAFQRLEPRFDGLHGIGHELGQRALAARGLRHDPVVASLLGQRQRPAPHVVGIDELALRHPARVLVVLDLLGRRLVPIGGVTQEDDAQVGHEIVAGGQLGVGAEVVRCRPEIRFELVDVLEDTSVH
jgi:hypothetical protein